MPRTISQKRSAIRKRVSYRFWRDIYDQLKGMELTSEAIGELLKLMFESMDNREMFRTQRQAFYDLQSVKQVMEDFEVPIPEEPPHLWKWPELTDNK